MKPIVQHYQKLPTEKGNYLLFFHFPEKQNLEIGALGSQTLCKGKYLYAGSALGLGGIRARVKHHFTSNAKPHWHMDYLRPHLCWIAVAWKITPERLECRWIERLLGNLAEIPVHGFGASDCRSRCPAHLVRITHSPQAVLKMLGEDGDLGIMYNKANF